MEATLENGSTGYVLGPTARGHTTLASTQSPAMPASSGLVDTRPLAGVEQDTLPVRDIIGKPIEQRWICFKCNIVLASPQPSQKKKRACSEGHNLEQPMSFFGALFGVILFVVAAALVSHVVGWFWNIPARLLSAFTVGAAMGLLPLAGLFKGVVGFVKGGPARQLAPRHFGLMLGGMLIICHPRRRIECEGWAVPG